MKNLKDRFSHYKLGIPELDDQHLEIIVMLEQMRSRIKLDKCLPSAGDCVGCNEKCVPETVLKLRKIFSEHTDFEEQYMRDIQFPFIIPHVEHHRIIFAQFDKIISAENPDQ